ITYAHQREQKGLAHALLSVEEHIDDDFMLILGDNIFDANLADVVKRQREDRADAAFLVEEVPYEEASRYGVCDTNAYGEITDVIEKPDDPPSNLVMTGVLHVLARHLPRLPSRPTLRPRRVRTADAIDLLIHSGRTISAVPAEGWRVDVGYPEDRARAERLVRAERGELGIDELDAAEQAELSSVTSAEDGD
ncbi:sugar phosphate nucleotidyltransferase, partial [Halogeometricum sp. CBA1124]|uniref:sugar phosphate nucleotidyltransferase n=1 Tax=Halogeometricum sp. CBA1124 TaxID=2668071 RepID=UPI001428FB0C|nr:UTP--glucose-1-phosphate uridylyltransferase [Halogeometricum sp. CBA1124]